ncbi:flagellar biosynthesis, cell-distal portion of basal-body rod [Klebsiella pneumoniae RYC492]|nr:flagellar biosynthesis, cell-distal portion of basal-body rod [Klebsiella pneumoniae RYC492]
MAELNPPLGTTTPEIFLDNVKRADELVNGPAGTVNDRAGEPLDTWRQMMAKNDEVRQNLIPLNKQYQTLAAAQADIANIGGNGKRADRRTYPSRFSRCEGAGESRRPPPGNDH